MGVLWCGTDAMAQGRACEATRAILRHEDTLAGMLARVSLRTALRAFRYALSASSRRCTAISSGVVA